MIRRGMAEVIPSGPAVESNAPTMIKKKRNLPGTPDPEAEVIALSPKTLMATNRYVCEICGKGFQRDQNLQLHRRGHNLPWKLKQRTTKEPRKRVYVCPEKSCLHHHPSRALGDLTGIKKHFCRKHGEKKWKCEKCFKRYAVQSDWKAHSKICGTREYKCSCSTIFSRRDSFITHRAFCDALAEETARVHAAANSFNYNANVMNQYNNCSTMAHHFSSIFKPPQSEMVDRQFVNLTPGQLYGHRKIFPGFNPSPMTNFYQQLNFDLGNKLPPSDCHGEIPTDVPFISTGANMSATALLQKAAQVGSTTSAADVDATELCGLYRSEGVTINSSVEISDVEDSVNDTCTNLNYYQSQIYPVAKRHKTVPIEEDCSGGQTRDFLGVGVPAICNPPSINGLF